MSSNTEKYLQQQTDRMRRAKEINSAVIAPQHDGAAFLGNEAERNANLEAAVSGTIYESLGKAGPMILGAHANAVRDYARQRGRMPSTDVLAGVHQTIENMIGSNAEGQTGQVFESVSSMNTTDGVILRDHMVALVMPVQLMTITNDMVTSVPANYDRSEIFKVVRRAGSTFGDLAAGDRIDESFNGQYGSMDQRKLAGTGDGIATQFVHDVTQPLKKSGSQAGGYIRVYLDRELVGSDDGKGNIYGPGLAASSVNYDTGVITVNFTAAPASGLEVHVGYDINIEKSPSSIPTVEHEIMSWTIMPHEAAIRGEVSLQSLYAARREYNMDLTSMTLSAMRNIMAADKDRKRLNDMWFFAKGSTEWLMTVPANQYYHEHYETIRETLLQISTDLMSANKRSGLVGLVAGKSACNLFRSLKDPHFRAAPGYREVPQPHYVGKLFGMWDLYCDPQAEEWEALCYARGRNHGEAGYVAADAISGVPLKHPVGTDMKFRDTLWELAYRDLHPDNGRDWFTKLVITHTGGGS
ncbi:MAG: hypothetical protein IBX50_04205 [Marinospirillum sp.]|uniref:hypothetical protein n=1 Tax=Marinospirillum sp. TaxID=2183934 RepID=UPI001A101294|nr:hypothetical protein [Marinospirillum sp.]MBE0505909.1 hypothetical protein [Marinospirillum sp.]